MAKSKATRPAPASLLAALAVPILNAKPAAKAVKVVPSTISITGLKVADIQRFVDDGSVTKADAAAELTRRITQRAMAGKHPMPFVIAARDELVAA